MFHSTTRLTIKWENWELTVAKWKCKTNESTSGCTKAKLRFSTQRFYFSRKKEINKNNNSNKHDPHVWRGQRVSTKDQKIAPCFQSYHKTTSPATSRLSLVQFGLVRFGFGSVQFVFPVKSERSERIQFCWVQNWFVAGGVREVQSLLKFFTQ